MSKVSVPGTTLASICGNFTISWALLQGYLETSLCGSPVAMLQQRQHIVKESLHQLYFFVPTPYNPETSNHPNPT